MGCGSDPEGVVLWGLEVEDFGALGWAAVGGGDAGGEVGGAAVGEVRGRDGGGVCGPCRQCGAAEPDKDVSPVQRLRLAGVLLWWW